MTYGRAPRIDDEIDWVRDEDGNILGYMVNPSLMEEWPGGEGGGAGANAYTTLTASFVQPAVNSAVTATVAATGFLAQGVPVYVAGGGFYLVASVLGPTSLSLTNLGYSPNASPGATVNSAGLVLTCGLKGDTGAAGAAAGGVVSSETTVAVTTTSTASDATFAVFADTPCTEIELENDTSVEFEYQRGGTGNTIVIQPGQNRRVTGITNANQIGVRRVDHASGLSRTITVTARALTSTEVFVVAGILNTTISSGGGNTQLATLACTALEIINTSGKMITWRIGTTAAYRRLKNGESVIVRGITNANQVYIKPYDSVASFTRPITVECFTSGLVAPLNSTRSARQIHSGARIMLDDGNYPAQLGQERMFVSVLEQGDQKSTLLPKEVKPLVFFSTVAGATLSHAGACTDSTAGELMFGTTALEYTQPGPSTDAYFAPAAALATGFDVTGNDIHIEYAFPDNAGVNYGVTANLDLFSIELYSAGTPASPGSDFHTASIGSSAQGFMKVDTRRGGTIVSFSVPIENFTAAGAGATLTAITWARFRARGSASAAGSKFRPYSIKAIKKARTKAAIFFLFDDLHIGQYTNALPILAKYNYPACIGIDTVTKMGQTNFITPQQLVTLHQKFGWQIVGQVQGGQGAGTTTDTAISAEHAIEQMARYKAQMKALGISGTQDFSRGSSSFHSNSGPLYDNWPTLKRGFRTSVEFFGGNNANPPFPHGETAPFGDPYAIRRVNMGGFTATTLATRWQNHIDQAVATKGVAGFGAHSEFNSAGEALTALATTVEYIRTLEIAGTAEVLTLDQICKTSY
jgi:hypothetical protein